MEPSGTCSLSARCRGRGWISDARPSRFLGLDPAGDRGAGRRRSWSCKATPIPHSTYEHGEIAANLLAGRGFSVRYLGADGPTSQQAPAYPFAGRGGLPDRRGRDAPVTLDPGAGAGRAGRCSWWRRRSRWPSSVAAGSTLGGAPGGADRRGRPDFGLLGDARSGGRPGHDLAPHLPWPGPSGPAGRVGRATRSARGSPWACSPWPTRSWPSRRRRWPGRSPGEVGIGRPTRLVALVGVAAALASPPGWSATTGSTASSCRSRVRSATRSGRATAP